MGTTQQRGAWAERLAAEWLMEHGFRLCHTNWRSGRYELDIVARKGATIHFVEVKCRRRRGLTAPEEALTPAKFRALCRAAEAYIATYSIDLEPQFDAITIEHDANAYDLKYIPNAMTPSWSVTPVNRR